MDRHLIRHLISTKINIGHIHLLNNGIICRMEDSDLINECGPCTFSKYKIINPDKGVECIYISSLLLRMNRTDECYSSIRRDTKRIINARIKSLFIISKLKLEWKERINARIVK